MQYYITSIPGECEKNGNKERGFNNKGNIYMDINTEIWYCLVAYKLIDFIMSI